MIETYEQNMYWVQTCAIEFATKKRIDGKLICVVAFSTAKASQWKNQLLCMIVLMWCKQMPITH